MKKLWPAFLITFASVMSACVVGEGDVGDDDNIVGPGNPENPNAVRCSSSFKTTGSFNQSAPRPTVTEQGDPRQGEPIQGCWPVGTWTFTVTHDPDSPALDVDGDGVGDKCGDVSGTSLPAIEASYSFIVTRVEDADAGGLVENYEYNGSSPNFFSVKVTEGGGGDCQGGMEFVNADKTQWWHLNPTICTSDETRPPEEPKLCTAWGNRQILGTGEFTHYLAPREY